MAVTGFDNFNGTASTTLQSHSPDSGGGSWTPCPGSSGNIVLNGSGACYDQFDNGPFYRNTQTPASADYTTRVYSKTNSGQNGPGPIIRASSSVNTRCRSIYHNGVGDWLVYDMVAGVETLKGSYTGDVPTTQRDVTLAGTGTGVVLAIGGVTRVSYTTAIVAAGFSGIYSVGSSATAYSDYWALEEAGGPSNVTITPTRQTISLAGNAPVITRQTFISLPSATLTMAGQFPNQELGLPGIATGALNFSSSTPSLALGVSRSPLSGSLALSGIEPLLFKEDALAPAAGAVSIAGFAPRLGGDIALSPITGSTSFTGFAPVLGGDITIAPTPAGIAITGYEPSIGLFGRIAVSAGSLSLVGYQPNATQAGDSLLSAEAGALLLVGQYPDQEIGLSEIATGVMTFTGIAPVLFNGYGISAGVGALIMAGLAPSIIKQETIAPGSAALLFAGNPPSVGGLVAIQPSSGALLLAGSSPALSWQFSLGPQSGGISIVGNQPSILASRLISPSTGALSIAGNSPLLTMGILTPFTGQLVFNGGAPAANETNPDAQVNGFGPARRMRLWL